MDADCLLKQYTIPDPCPMKWDDMDGDDNSRYCTACGKHVHDLTAVSPEDAAGLVQNGGDDLCVRLYLHDNDTVATSAPRDVLKRPARRLQFTIRSIMGVIGSVAAAFGIARLIDDHMPPPAFPPPPTSMQGGMRPLSSVLDEPANRPTSTSAKTSKRRLVMGMLKRQ